ncbi:HpcH/HpaI aldolase/citrate lyase family protein [Deinococcus yavapaiensis]|uniref:Citrate lyase subunit beta/citryl-CoA lyase n=1 Tax=Deinococcus yavapaiensis KR-236 TaxID=694435 RepID=A0A318S2U4_9DEIO|nr:CoA ester lyase [Deinococcus yavapaiensis]PYE51144.1 citrate lyase subunit beta/citryl-CoA lyase [Deinococcus yavapaiensis KR-236]
MHRSALYVPADNTRALEKARILTPDVLILDLEDGVAPEHKTRARENVREALASLHGRRVVVRMNGLDTPWGDDDLQLLLELGPHAIMLPKAEKVEDVRSLSVSVPVWLTIETPLGVLRAEELARERGVACLVMGTSDLVTDLRAKAAPNREALLYALSHVVLVARAYGRVVLDGVSLDVQDMQGFEAQCQQGRALGFDGKTLIHPSQIEPCHRVFGPTEDDVGRAHELLAVWKEARAGGKSVAVLHGRLVENLHAAEAREVLRLAEELERN